MRKIYFLLFFMVFVNNIARALSLAPLPPDYEAKGFIIDFDIDYGKTFDNNISIINMKMFSPFLPDENKISGIFGISTTFSLDISILDLYFISGITLYPFKKYLSLTFDIGLGFSYILFLNHFPYILSVKGNFDIPIYKEQYLTIGAGVQHRNSIKIFDYLKLNKNYYGMYNSYFFEIGYRKFIK